MEISLVCTQVEELFCVTDFTMVCHGCYVLIRDYSHASIKSQLGQRFRFTQLFTPVSYKSLDLVLCRKSNAHAL